MYVYWYIFIVLLICASWFFEAVYVPKVSLENKSVFIFKEEEEDVMLNTVLNAYLMIIWTNVIVVLCIYTNVYSRT